MDMYILHFIIMAVPHNMLIDHDQHLSKHGSHFLCLALAHVSHAIHNIGEILPVFQEQE